MVYAHLPRLPARTASASQSIWFEVPEATFRSHLVELEKRTNAVPLDSQVFSSSEWLSLHPDVSDSNPRLPLTTEQRLADDISYLLATGEGAQSVSAATVQVREPSQQPQPGSVGHCDFSVRITVASIDAVEPISQSFLRLLFEHLANVSGKNRSEVTHHIFTLVSSHHNQRLLNRLRSSRWTKPTYLSRTHKKPLHADFAYLLEHFHLHYSRRERAQRGLIKACLSSLASDLQAFEVPPENPEAECLARRSLIRACYEFCTAPPVTDFYRRIKSKRPTSQIQACLKTLQQTEKIAAYYRITLTLVDLALEHSSLFRSADLVFLEPYEATPLEIAYQPWATSTHVHAEVNLAVHHDMSCGSGGWSKPRCIGASKYLCFLCYLFIRKHDLYFPSATHGACYDQWTLPDLAEYPAELRERYRAIIKGVNEDVLVSLDGAVRRLEPMTSRENLIEAAWVRGRDEVEA